MTAASFSGTQRQSVPNALPWIIGALLAIAAMLPRCAQAQTQPRICIMNADGTQMRTLAEMAGYTWHGSPHWSHDGKQIAFDGTQGGTELNHIFLVDAAGGEPRDIGLGSQPSFSADDKQLCFYMHEGNPDDEKPGIYVMNITGKGPQFIAPGIRPRWSGDGSRIAYVSPHDGANTIWIYSIVDAESKPIVSEEIAGLSSPPVWSRDGKQIAFLRRQPGKDLELCVVEADEKFTVTVKAKEQVASVSPCWLPGNKILFAISQGGNSPAQPRWLDPDKADAPTPIPCSVSRFWDPNWSPDMKQIAFGCEP